MASPAGVALARPSVALFPRRPGAAPIQFSFASFPAIFLYFGRGAREVFPPCGCDARGYTAERQIRKMVETVEVARGSLWRVWSDYHERCLGEFELGLTDAAPIRWDPWPRRARD